MFMLLTMKGRGPAFKMACCIIIMPPQENSSLGNPSVEKKAPTAVLVISKARKVASKYSYLSSLNSLRDFFIFLI